MLRRAVIFFCLFTLFLLYLVFSCGWYEPAVLVIKGRVLDTGAVIDVQWDSGEGFNDYEREQFSFLTNRNRSGIPHRIVVTGGGEKNPASKGNRVVLAEVRLDDRGVYLPDSALHNVRYVRGTGWVFTSRQSVAALKMKAEEQIYFAFKANTHSGIVRIAIDGQESIHDLYRENWEIIQEKLRFWFLDEQGGFSLSCAMPRYGVDSLRISVPVGTLLSSLALKTKTGTIIPLVHEDLGNGQFILAKPSEPLRHYFHTGRFIQQLFFALILTWAASGLLGMIHRCGGAKAFFMGRELRLFWLLFSGAVIVYSFFLLSFWPGVLSVDSMNVWRAAWLPDVMINNHPLLNVLFYTLLLLLWNNVAVVPLSQILLLSLLIAVTFYYCHRRGVALAWLLPCYLLLLFSLPVGLYNVTLWKDVPFALLVIFWGLTTAYFFLKKRETGRVRLTRQQAASLLLLFLALVLIRHNGMIYLFTLPLLFLALGLIRISRVVLLSGLAAVLVLTALVLLPPKSLKSSSYFYDLSQTYLRQLLREDPVDRIKQVVSRYPRLLDVLKNKKTSDFWHYYLGDRYAYTFLRQVEWNDTHGYHGTGKPPVRALHSFIMGIYWKSLDYPWVYLTWNPFWLLYLFPLSIVFYRRFPLSAIFSSVILIQIGALLFFVNTVNWRYYYFVLPAGYFFLPVLLLDLRILGERKMKIGS
jgi:hypothetical protein